MKRFLSALLALSILITPALALAEKIRVSASAMRYEAEERVFDVTVSIGALSLDEYEDEHTILSRADRVLHMAKSEGRDRVASGSPGNEDLAALDATSRWAARVRDGLRPDRE